MGTLYRSNRKALEPYGQHIHKTPIVFTLKSPWILKRFFFQYILLIFIHTDVHYLITWSISSYMLSIIMLYYIFSFFGHWSFICFGKGIKSWVHHFITMHNNLTGLKIQSKPIIKYKIGILWVDKIVTNILLIMVSFYCKGLIFLGLHITPMKCGQVFTLNSFK